MSLIFATHQQFELACRMFIAKHAQDQKKAEDELGYSSRVLGGWRWKNHPVSIPVRYRREGNHNLSPLVGLPKPRLHD